QLTRSSGASRLRSSTAVTSSSVASRMAPASFSVTVVAPRSARSLTRGILTKRPGDELARLKFGLDIADYFLRLCGATGRQTQTQGDGQGWPQWTRATAS